MTTEDKVIKAKMTLLDLAEYLKNVSEACRVSGVSRQHFYDIKQTYQEGGMEALREKSRRQPNLKNRVAPEVEEAILQLALELPAYGQVRVANELKKKGILVSAGGVRTVWVRHGLETMKQRLKKLEEKAAKEGIVYTEAQVVALERYRQETEYHPDVVETHHSGYLLSQDTFYVGYLKGVGRIYQQTVVDTYPSLAFAKLYTSKVPVTSADTLNDKVLPFYEEQGVKVLRILTDRGTEYCGRLVSGVTQNRPRRVTSKPAMLGTSPRIPSHRREDEWRTGSRWCKCIRSKDFGSRDGLAGGSPRSWGSTARPSVSTSPNSAGEVKTSHM